MGIGSNLGAGVSLLNFHDSVSLGGGERLLSGGSGLRSKEGKGMRMGLGAGFNGKWQMIRMSSEPRGGSSGVMELSFGKRLSHTPL